MTGVKVAYNKLPKFAAKSAAGTNTHWASPNNVRIFPLAKRYIFLQGSVYFNGKKVTV